MDDDRVIWRSELRELMNKVSSETIRRWLRDGKIPKPDVQLSRKSQGWKLSTLRAHGLPIA